MIRARWTITFDEAINVTAVDLTKLHVSNAGQSNEVSLDGADFNRTAPNSDTISMTLSQAQLSLIMGMETPQLDIGAGAVSDLVGNTIDAAPDNHILIFRAGSDTVLWNATITAEYDDADTQSIGWNSGHIGSVGYNAPTMDGTFILNGTTYTVRGLYEQVAKAPASVDLRISSYIPESERGSVYVAVGDARCSIAAAQATRGNTGSFYKWNQTVFPSPPFSNGANITAAILYNSNYLTLNGNSTVTVQQGDAYADEGAFTPDNATVASNATALDASTAGTYEIHYNATKGCGLLDTATRTVDVLERDIIEPSFVSAALNVGTREMTITFDETVRVSGADLTKLHVSDAGQAGAVSLSGADFNRTAPDSSAISATLTWEQLNQILLMTAPQL